MKGAWFVLAFGLCCAMTACSKQSPTPGPGAANQSYTENDVRSFVLPGTSREAIVARFGQPNYVQRNPKFEDGSTNIDEIIFFDLPFPNPPRNVKWGFAGFQVHLKEGKAVDWFATHEDIHINSPTDEGRFWSRLELTRCVNTPIGVTCL